MLSELGANGRIRATRALALVGRSSTTVTISESGMKTRQAPAPHPATGFPMWVAAGALILGLAFYLLVRSEDSARILYLQPFVSYTN